MIVKNVEAWQEWVDSNTDPYGEAVIIYAERWANLMESKMEEGAELEDIAKNTSHEADTDGITGFMYGAAVQVLSQCWEYGERLRKWNNLDIQISNEGEKANEDGGTLNPALISIGTKE
jgi:hypothetical protein